MLPTHHELDVEPAVPFRWDLAADLAVVESFDPSAVPGGVSVLSLRQVLLGAHLGQLADLDTACETAVLRLLTALVIRSSGLHTNDVTAWTDRWGALLSAGQFDEGSVNAYFDRWRDRFDLFHSERPFLQDPRLETEVSKVAPPGRLVMTRASGSNQPWHNRMPQDIPVDVVDAFHWLLVWRLTGPAGMGGQRTHEGISSKSMSGARVRAAVSFHPRTRTLFHDLLLACPSPVLVPLAGEDLPEWEVPLADPLNPPLVGGPVGRLVGGVTHAVHLVPGDSYTEVVGCRIAWALPVASAGRSDDEKQRLKEILANFQGAEDLFVVNRDRGGPLRASWRRSLLRDFETLIAFSGSAAPGVRPPLWIQAYRSLTSSQRQLIGPVRVRVCGLHQDKQDKNEHWWTAETPADVAPLLDDPERTQRAAELRDQAEAAATALGRALRSCWRAMSPDPHSDCPWTTDAEATYWARAERPFWSAVTEDAAPDFRKLAMNIFDAATREAGKSAEGLLPVAAARSRLFRNAVPRTSGRKGKS